MVPPAVFAELSAGSAAHPEIDAVLNSAWLEVRTLSQPENITELLLSLDLGESEAIQLAQEMHAEFLLIDERDGRQAALARGIRVIGLAGILLNARKSALLGPLRPIFESLVHELDFHIQWGIVETLLKEVGE